MEKIRNLGKFNHISEVWEKYPNGGLYGDYLVVADTELYWSETHNDWVNEMQINPDHQVHDIPGDVIVRQDLIVGGELRAYNIYPADKGLYATSEILKQEHPNSRKGDWALVGLVSPFAIWRHNGYHWEDTGEEEYLGENPLRLVIDTDGDHSLAFGETLNVRCIVYKGLNDLTANSSFTITRNTGNQQEDTVWNQLPKAKSFQHSGRIALSLNAEEDDIGMDNESACFTITATVAGEAKPLAMHLII